MARFARIISFVLFVLLLVQSVYVDGSSRHALEQKLQGQKALRTRSTRHKEPVTIIILALAITGAVVNGGSKAAVAWDQSVEDGKWNKVVQEQTARCKELLRIGVALGSHLDTAAAKAFEKVEQLRVIMKTSGKNTWDSSLVVEKQIAHDLHVFSIALLEFKSVIGGLQCGPDAVKPLKPDPSAPVKIPKTAQEQIDEAFPLLNAVVSKSQEANRAIEFLTKSVAQQLEAELEAKAALTGVLSSADGLDSAMKMMLHSADKRQHYINQARRALDLADGKGVTDLLAEPVKSIPLGDTTVGGMASSVAGTSVGGSEMTVGDLVPLDGLGSTMVNFASVARGEKAFGEAIIQSAGSLALSATKQVAMHVIKDIGTQILTTLISEGALSVCGGVGSVLTGAYAVWSAVGEIANSHEQRDRQAHDFLYSICKRDLALLAALSKLLDSFVRAQSSAHFSQEERTIIANAIDTIRIHAKAVFKINDKFVWQCPAIMKFNGEKLTSSFQVGAPNTTLALGADAINGPEVIVREPKSESGIVSESDIDLDLDMDMDMSVEGHPNPLNNIPSFTKPAPEEPSAWKLFTDSFPVFNETEEFEYLHDVIPVDPTHAKDPTSVTCPAGYEVVNLLDCGPTDAAAPCSAAHSLSGHGLVNFECEKTKYNQVGWMEHLLCAKYAKPSSGLPPVTGIAPYWETVDSIIRKFQLVEKERFTFPDEKKACTVWSEQAYFVPKKQDTFRYGLQYSSGLPIITKLGIVEGGKNCFNSYLGSVNFQPGKEHLFVSRSRPEHRLNCCHIRHITCELALLNGNNVRTSYNHITQIDMGVYWHPKKQDLVNRAGF